MTPEAFLEQFDAMAEAPNGVQKLRELILQLAVRGKLVPQDPSDDPAPALLASIRRGKSKQAAARPPQADALCPMPEPAPFEVPATWTWVRLGEVVDQRLGKMLDKAKNKGTLYPYLRNTNVQWLRFDLSDVKSMRFEPEELEEYAVRNGDLLICEGGEPGRAAVWAGSHAPMKFQKAIHRVRPCSGVSVWYILYNLLAATHDRRIERYFTGATIKHLTGRSLESFLLPLAPAREQLRIVARVGELLALCDQLEKRQRHRADLRTRANSSALKQLADASDEQGLAGSWERLRRAFPMLYNSPETLTELRVALLELATRGKLVPQNPIDEPARVLFQRITAARQQQLGEGRSSSPKPLPSIQEGELWFNLPDGWVWSRVGEVTSKIGSGSTPLGGKTAYVAAGVKFLRSQNIWNDGLQLDDVAFIPEETHRRMSGTTVRPGDLLLNITGASIGRSALVPADFDEANVSQHVSIVRPVLGETGAFLHIALTSPSFQEAIMRTQVGISREGLSIGRLSEMVIPLPPLAEQQRIVAQVRELMALCDAVEERLAAARERSSHLAAAIVHRLGAA